jgi:hypothetical protein
MLSAARTYSPPFQGGVGGGSGRVAVCRRRTGARAIACLTSLSRARWRALFPSCPTGPPPAGPARPSLVPTGARWQGRLLDTIGGGKADSARIGPGMVSAGNVPTKYYCTPALRGCQGDCKMEMSEPGCRALPPTGIWPFGNGHEITPPVFPSPSGTIRRGETARGSYFVPVPYPRANRERSAQASGRFSLDGFRIVDCRLWVRIGISEAFPNRCQPAPEEVDASRPPCGNRSPRGRPSPPASRLNDCLKITCTDCGKGGTSLSAAKGVVHRRTTPFVFQGVPPNLYRLFLPRG